MNRMHEGYRAGSGSKEKGWSGKGDKNEKSTRMDGKDMDKDNDMDAESGDMDKKSGK